MFDNNINNANKYAIMLAMSRINNIDITRNIIDEKIIYNLKSKDEKINISFNINNLENNINSDVEKFICYIFDLNEIVVERFDTDIDIIKNSLLFFNHFCKLNIKERMALYIKETGHDPVSPLDINQETYDKIITTRDTLLKEAIDSNLEEMNKMENSALSIEYDALIMTDYILSSLKKDKIYFSSEELIDSIDSSLILYYFEPILRELEQSPLSEQNNNTENQ